MHPAVLRCPASPASQPRDGSRSRSHGWMSLGIGIGIAAIGGWLLILMLVYLLQALTALPRWACDGLVRETPAKRNVMTPRIWTILQWC